MNKLCFLLITGFFLIVVTLQAQTTAIQNALRNYDYEKALTLLAKEKNNPENNLQKARCLRSLNRFEDAIQLLDPIVKETNGNIAAITELAQCYEALGKLQKAAFFYLMGLDARPDNRFLELNYITILYRLHKWRETIDKANQILKTDTVAGILPLIGDSYFQLNKTDSALIKYDLSLRKFPFDYITALKMAKLCTNTNNTSKLLQITHAYLEKDSSNAEIHMYAGIGHFMQKDYKNALYRFNRAHELGDSTFLLNYYTGITQLTLENYSGAYQNLKTAYNQDSSNINLHYYYCKAGIYSGFSYEVIPVLKHTISKLMPNDTILFNYNYLLSEGCERSGKTEMEINALKECYKYRPEYKFALYRIASLYDNKLKSPDEACIYYRRFAALRPKESKTDSQREISYYTVAENRAGELLEMIKKQK